MEQRLTAMTFSSSLKLQRGNLNILEMMLLPSFLKKWMEAEEAKQHSR